MRKPPPDPEAFAIAWRSMKTRDICARFGLTRRSIYRWAEKYRLGPKPEGTHGRHNGRQTQDATEEEIREYTLSLQSTWSEAERQRRAGKSKLAVAVKAMGYDGRVARFTEKEL